MEMQLDLSLVLLTDAGLVTLRESDWVYLTVIPTEKSLDSLLDKRKEMQRVLMMEICWV